MDIHKNARLTFISREELAKSVLLRGLTLNAAAAAFHVTAKTAAKWRRRYQLEGLPGLLDRSSRPHCCPRRISPDLVGRIETLRRQRLTGVQIAFATHLSRATVSRTLRRLGLNRIRDLEPAPPIVRYERATPGELLHLDIKQLGRIAHVGQRILGPQTPSARGIGWEYLHVAIDDHSRLAFSQILHDQTQYSAVRFLHAALHYYARLGIRVRAVMTDNGGCYDSREFRHACHHFGLIHIRTRPYTPRTNGKAERFIQTALREWAYAHAYNNSLQRTCALAQWVHQYNWHRPHASLNHAPPISRSGLDRNNLLRHDKY